MGVITIWTVAIAIYTAGLPSIELRAVAKQVALPARAAEEWDAIGTYVLKGKKVATTVKLYYVDSDSIADKEMRKGGFGGRIYPNHFSIHVVYREGNGPWKHKQLYGVYRVGFWKVADVKPDAITIQVRSKHLMFSEDVIRFRFSDEDLRRIYEPVPLRVTLKDGVPSLN
jgi:hypothetical protein